MQFKQKTIQYGLHIWRAGAFCAGLWVFCTVEAATLQPATLPPTLGDQVAKLRLISVAGLNAGRYAVGVEIVMAPGSHTYWMQPGEAGVPPVFAFNGSQNVAKADIAFPVPTRIVEEGIEAFGYADRVVFPVAVIPAEPKKPALLKASVNYAVCNKICIPAHGTASVELSPDDAGVDADAVKAALDDVPVPASASERAALTIEPDRQADKPSWTLTWSGAPAVDDMFAVAPEGFFFATRKIAPNRFSLVAEEVVGASKGVQVPVTLTLARGDRSLVVGTTLDVPGISR